MKIPGNVPNKINSPEHLAGKNAGKAGPRSGVPVKPDAAVATTAGGKAAVNTANQARAAIAPGTNLSQLLSLLKLPQDNLSKSIVAFARFFSLPLEPKLMASLRRDALAQGRAAPGGASREAAALGAAAAADKGLRLGEKILGDYAAAIEGSLKHFAEKEPPGARESREPQERNAGEDGGSESGGYGSEQGGSDNSGREGGGQYGERGRSGGGELPPPADGLRRRDDGGGQTTEENLSGGELRRRVSEILKERPPLDFINRVPGKKGRWIVVPFSFSRGGLEFSVSLRILAGAAGVSGVPLERLTADIAVTRAGDPSGAAVDKAADVPEKARRWYVSVERPAAAATPTSAEGGELPPESADGKAAYRALVFCDAENLSPTIKKRLARELTKILDLPPGNVTFTEKQPLFADSRIDHLLSVDEEV